MTENNLVYCDNDTLAKEYEYFIQISPRSNKPEFRQAYLSEMKAIFDASDQKKNGKIDRQEFETLIKGYFELKGIQSTSSNYDAYFQKLDINHNHCITLKEFTQFMDQVMMKDIIPYLSEEMQNRDLF